MPTHQSVIERQNLLLNILPMGDPGRCGVKVNELLVKISHQYAGELYSKGTAGKRMLQRDLKALEDDEWVSSASGIRNYNLYARIPPEEGMSIDGLAFQHLVEGLDPYCSGVSRARRLEVALRRLLSEDGGLVISTDRFMTIDEGEIVLPAEFRPAVLAALLHGVAAGKVVEGVYVRQGQRTELTLHVQAAIHRGHDLMILAVDEARPAEGLQTFLLHYFTSARVVKKAPAIRLAGSELILAIQRALGLEDQAANPPLTLELLARGGAAELLRDCPLTVHQRYYDSVDEDGGYEARVIATVTPSARLLRWLAGWGADIKVIGPPAVAELLAQRAAAAAALYDEEGCSGDLPLAGHRPESSFFCPRYN